MRKINKILIFSFILICVFSTNVVAHSGGTDGKGGHTDSSTGEYHYHHGYSAHDHYDIDGDGDLDCPYNFKNATTSSNSKSGINFSNSSSETPYITRYIIPPVIWWLAAGIALTIFGLVRVIRHKTDELHDALSYKHSAETKAERSTKHLRAEIIKRMTLADQVEVMQRKVLYHSYPSDAKINFRDPYPFSLFKDFNNNDDPFQLPQGVKIMKNGLVSLGWPDEKDIYGKYTVYITHNGKCFHNNPRCQKEHAMFAIDIMTAMDARRPCSICYPQNSDEFQVPQWYINFQRASNDLGIKW